MAQPKHLFVFLSACLLFSACGEGNFPARTPSSRDSGDTESGADEPAAEAPVATDKTADDKTPAKSDSLDVAKCDDAPKSCPGGALADKDPVTCKQTCPGE